MAAVADAVDFCDVFEHVLAPEVVEVVGDAYVEVAAAVAEIRSPAEAEVSFCHGADAAVVFD